MNTMDRNYVQGHGVVEFRDLRLPADAVLGEVGQALRYAQLRLTPARLTHCMRWLGAASRAHSIAVDYARTRTAFGKPLGEHQGVGFMLADNEIALQQCRLAIWWACWALDTGAKGRHESSMVKAYVRGTVQGGRPLRPDPGRDGHFRRDAGRHDLLRHARLPALRRADRGAQVRDRPPGAEESAMSILDSFRLTDKVVVVTGASSGLGVSFAQAFAEAGADLVLGARRVERMAQTAALVEAAGRRVYTRMTDVADPERCQALVDSAVEAFGRVDVLINNAGVGTAVPATRRPRAVPRGRRRQPARLVLDGAGLCAGDAAGQCDRQRLQHPRAHHWRPAAGRPSASKPLCWD